MPVLTKAHRITEEDRTGNNWADIYAHSAANLDVETETPKFLDFPLYPISISDPSSDYLPL